MYTPVEIAHLSESQISKLLSGNPVRVKSGNGHVVHLSTEQVKKHNRASIKGAGYNLTLDPYQMARHVPLRGSGVGSKAKQAFKKVGQFVKGNKQHFRPLANELKSMANQSIADASGYALEQGVNPELASYYSSLASSTMDTPYAPHGGSLKSFSRFMNKPAVRDIRRALKPVGQALFNTAEDMALQGIQMAPQMLAMSSGMPVGMGLKKKGRPRKGGALQVAGHGY